mmetsp:Transcript_112027/g.215722  ORF Transcript_112027/g.215722 Transcript_112027/m.215722 type:complete len:316 (-) Transcript_112027:95-1042(-)
MAASSSAAAQSVGGDAGKTFAVGDKVQYWSDSKGKWLDAEVLGKSEKDGTTVYDLDKKRGAALEKVRPRPTAAKKSTTGKASAFISFDNFDMKQSIARTGKRGHQDSDDEEEVKRPRGADDGKQAAAASKVPLSVDWSNAPAAFLPAVEFQGAAAFVDHFVRWAVGEWNRKLQEEGSAGSHCFAGSPDAKSFASPESLQQEKARLAPLLEQLHHGSVNKEVLEQLNKMVLQAESREYAAASQTYLALTMGKKLWNNGHASFTSQQQHGGSVKMMTFDPLTIYDSDPVAQKYLQGLRRLISFTQVVRPNADASKHM